MKETTLIIFPTVFEANAPFSFLGFQGKVKVGSVCETEAADGGRLVAIVSGFGTAATKKRIDGAVKKFAPSHIILAGFSGACDESLKNGQLIYAAECEKISEEARKLGGQKCEIACVDHIALADEKKSLGGKGFRGVEMEGDLVKSAISECGGENVKFSHLRWISDSVESKIPMSFFDSAMDFETGEMLLGFSRIAKQVLKSPTLLFELVKFSLETAPAKKKYDAEIVKILRSIKK